MSDYLAEREAHAETRDRLHGLHGLLIRDAVNDAIASVPDADHPILRELIASLNPRVSDDTVVVDFPGRELVGTVAELLTWMESQPEQHGNLLHPARKREPTPQEKHLRILAGDSMEQYMKRRKPGGGHFTI